MQSARVFVNIHVLPARDVQIEFRFRNRRLFQFSQNNDISNVHHSPTYFPSVLRLLFLLGINLNFGDFTKCFTKVLYFYDLIYFHLNLQYFKINFILLTFTLKRKFKNRFKPTSQNMLFCSTCY